MTAVALDPRVDEAATDPILPLESRIELLAEMLPFAKNEHDRLNIESWIECLATQRLARDRRSSTERVD